MSLKLSKRKEDFYETFIFILITLISRDTISKKKPRKRNRK